MIIKSFTIRLNGISEEDFDEMLDVVKSYFEIIKINKQSKNEHELHVFYWHG